MHIIWQPLQSGMPEQMATQGIGEILEIDVPDRWPGLY
jgi:hypothetical protein